MRATAFSKRYGVLEVLQGCDAWLRNGASKADAIHCLYVNGDGTFPNNSHYPLLLYKNVSFGTQSETFNKIVASGEWTSPWVWGIFTFHHYHSNAWELLFCTQGEAKVQLGGPSGPEVNVETGDLLLIPPGVAHKQLRDSGGFTLLGSYPTSTQSGPVDTLRGSPTPKEQENISTCPLPPKDPFLGLHVKDIIDA